MLIPKLVEKFERRISKLGSIDTEDARTNKVAYELMVRYYRRFLELGPDAPVCWYEGSAPWEILDAMGVAELNMELLGSHAIASAPEYIDTAASVGFAPDTCSRTRSSIGMCIKEALPRPTFIMAEYNVCESPIKAMQYFAHNRQTPIVYMDIPYYESEDTLAYTVAEHQRAITRIEEIIGRELDQERLKESILKTRRIYGLLREISDYTVAVPSPLHGRDWLRNVGLSVLSRDDPRMVDYLTSQLAMVKARVEEKKGALARENYRIGWLSTPPLFTDVFARIEQEFDAAIVFCEFADIFPGMYAEIFEDDEAMERPLLAMSKRALRHPWQGPVQRRIDWVLKLAERYKVDACIQYSQWGCRHTSLSIGMVKEALRGELGVRTLVIEGDYFDFRNYSEEDLLGKIESFLETI